MAEPYAIHIEVLDGDPSGPMRVTRGNQPGIIFAFPRLNWSAMRSRPEFGYAGVYVLVGPSEDDDMPTVYIGQGDGIGDRIATHDGNKEFWDRGYAYVCTGNTLNRAHITWLEHALIKLAKDVGRCRLDNVSNPREPSLTGPDLVDTRGFLRTILSTLPLLGVPVFEKGVIKPPPPPGTGGTGVVPPPGTRDTVIVPAQEPGFTECFLGENAWDAIRISGGMLDKIKYIAAYQTAPVSAITYYAPVDRIEPFGNGRKYRLIFAEPAQRLPQPIPYGDAPMGKMQSPRYTSLNALLSATCVMDLFPVAKDTT